MTERLGPVFLEFLISDSLKDPFVQGQVCKTLNLMLRLTPQILRNNFFHRHFDQVEKASKLLDSVGDFEVQISLLEFLFRISSSTELAHNLFSSRPELGRAFVSISRGEFEIDARVFINVLNKSLGERTKVWTLPCLKAEVSS